MTLPINNENSLKATRNLLKEILSTPFELPKVFKEEAARCLKHFPRDDQIERWIELENKRLQELLKNDVGL